MEKYCLRWNEFESNIRNSYRELRKEQNHPSPFIYFKGIKRVELEHVIDFLYNGEANIAQEELTLFLDTAQELNLKGLQNGHQEGRGSEQFGPKYSEEELPAKVEMETNNIFPTEYYQEKELIKMVE